jgi:hypothetical protein
MTNGGENCLYSPASSTKFATLLDSAEAGIPVTSQVSFDDACAIKSAEMDNDAVPHVSDNSEVLSDFDGDTNVCT